jgi:hypothetical protein
MILARVGRSVILVRLAAVGVGVASMGFLPMPQPRPAHGPAAPVARVPTAAPSPAETSVTTPATAEAGAAADPADEVPDDRIAAGFALFDPFDGWELTQLPPLRPTIDEDDDAAPAAGEVAVAAAPAESIAAAGVPAPRPPAVEPPAAAPSPRETAAVPAAGVLGYAADAAGGASAALRRFEPLASAPMPTPAPPRPTTPPPGAIASIDRYVSVAVPVPKVRPLAPLLVEEATIRGTTDLPLPPSVLPRPRPAGPPVRLASLGTAPTTPLTSAAETEADEAEAAAADGVQPAGPRTTGEPRRVPAQAMPYLHVLRREARANGVPLWLAVGVGWVESRYQPSLRGGHGVLGLMQVMPATARFQGYRGTTEQLLDPETNIVWGMRELGWAWKRSGGDVCLTVAKYKSGIMTTSVSKAAADYCRSVRDVTGMNRLG